MEASTNSMVNKLILLFVFDKMDIPVTEATVIEMCHTCNGWIMYMDCIQALSQLLDTGFIYQTKHDKQDYYTITPDGRMCLANFYTRIPASLRSEIMEYIKENRMVFQRKQSYPKSYFKNPDGSYTVYLKIMDSVQTTLEMKLNVANRATAKLVCNKWEDKAAQVFYTLHEQLID